MTSDPTSTPMGETSVPVPSPTSTSVTDVEELPEGWTRVQVRGGMLVDPLNNPTASFTIDLPPGWEAGETWPASDGARGWIAGPEYGDRGQRAFLTYGIGQGFKYNVEQMSSDGRYDLRYPRVEGQPAILHLAQPFAVDDGPQVGIYFDHMPGHPEGANAPSLSIEGDSRGWDPELLAEVLTSVRYIEASADEAEIPVPQVVAGDDWVRTPASDNYFSFTMMLAPGWTLEERQGIDSLVGVLTDGDVTLYYDFGAFSSMPYSPQYAVRDGRPNREHTTWSEEINGKTYYFVMPESGEPDEHGVTGVFVSLVADLSFGGSGLDREQQETVLAMFRTLELEIGYPGAKSQ